RYWPEYEGPTRLLGFAGFKAGTTHVTIVDNRQGSLNYGKEVTFPVTVIETPPLKVAALRFYAASNAGLRTLGEVWSNDQDKDLRRIIKTPEKFDDSKGWEKLEASKDKLAEIRAVVASRPRTTTIGRKTPDLFEVKIDGGTVQDQLEFGKKILGKDLKISEVFKEGGDVDVISITKGKGIQGPVKRWGIKKLKHKRSEEHTSELQSRFDIVCRLLLEKGDDLRHVHAFPTRRSSDLVKIDGGTVQDQLEFGKKILGKDLKISEVFKEGGDVDVISITKGKGIQGPVKRWGIKKLKHKSRKTVRGVGSIGPWHPHYVMYSVPRAGQMGFAQRTEYNKEILKMGDNGAEVTPKGGFLRYGPVKTEYTVLR